MDPNNLKSGISVEMSTQSVTTDGRRVFSSVYPRFILCAQNPNTNLTKYEEIKIHYIQPNDLVDIGY